MLLFYYQERDKAENDDFSPSLSRVNNAETIINTFGNRDKNVYFPHSLGK